MTRKSQLHAIRNYRQRLSQSGCTRFEILARTTDRELLRSLAKRLADDSEASQNLRLAITQALRAAEPKRGGILEALRRAPNLHQASLEK